MWASPSREEAGIPALAPGDCRRPALPSRNPAQKEAPLATSSRAAALTVGRRHLRETRSPAACPGPAGSASPGAPRARLLCLPMAPACPECFAPARRCPECLTIWINSFQPRNQAGAIGVLVSWDRKTAPGVACPEPHSQDAGGDAPALRPGSARCSQHLGPSAASGGPGSCSVGRPRFGDGLPHPERAVSLRVVTMLSNFKR